MRAVAPVSAAAVVLVMAAAVAAPPGRSGFAVRADRVCAATGAASAAVAARRSPDDTAATHLLAQAALAREQLDSLADLPAGPGEQQRKARLVSAFAAAADILGEYARATRRGDQETRKALAVPGGPAERSGREARAAAASLGLEVCARYV
jgi:hypothetical protein